jgi:hypothetical protein
VPRIITNYFDEEAHTREECLHHLIFELGETTCQEIKEEEFREFKRRMRILHDNGRLYVIWHVLVVVVVVIPSCKAKRESEDGLRSVGTTQWQLRTRVASLGLTCSRGGAEAATVAASDWGHGCYSCFRIYGEGVLFLKIF